jgi:hypothetical protein
MSTDTVSPQASHLRSVTVTALAALAGIGAAVASAVVTADSATPATDQLAIYVFVAAVVVQFPVLGLLDRAGLVAVDVSEFGAKDYLYIAFMTFSLWFVSWTILLTSGASV